MVMLMVHDDNYGGDVRVHPNGVIFEPCSVYEVFCSSCFIYDRVRDEGSITKFIVAN